MDEKQGAGTDRVQGMAMLRQRFSKVGKRYPSRVWRAYGGDVAAALAADDLKVGRKVIRWECAQGYVPSRWPRGVRTDGTATGPGA